MIDDAEHSAGSRARQARRVVVGDTCCGRHVGEQARSNRSSLRSTFFSHRHYRTKELAANASRCSSFLRAPAFTAGLSGIFGGSDSGLYDALLCVTNLIWRTPTMRVVHSVQQCPAVGLAHVRSRPSRERSIARIDWRSRGRRSLMVGPSGMGNRHAYLCFPITALTQHIRALERRQHTRRHRAGSRST